MNELAQTLACKECGTIRFAGMYLTTSGDTPLYDCNQCSKTGIDCPECDLLIDGVLYDAGYIE